MDPHPQDDLLDLSQETCSLEVARDGVCGQIECGERSSVVCASEDCCNCPCERHLKVCPTCGKYFCESSDRRLWTCFFLHVQEGKCAGEILRAPLGKLAKAFASEQHRELYDFVCCDSDGLGHPLPKEACLNLGLAVAYSNDVLPEYNEDVLIARDVNNRLRRARLQKRRRSAKRLGIVATRPPTPEATRLAPHRSSTIHIVTGALVVLHWTGSWHYRQQLEMLNIMGLSKSQDFVRDKVDYLRGSNQEVFEKIESWARDLRNDVKLKDSRILSPDLSL